jgi:hypothetical protein
MDLVAVLSRRCKVPHLSLERYQISTAVVDLVPADFARANRLVPLQKLGKVLNVATTNPLDVGTFKRLEEQSGLRVKPVLATPSHLTECLNKCYPPPPEEASAREPEEEIRVSVKDFLKESWLGAVGPPADESSTSLPAVRAEEESAEQGAGAETSAQEEGAIPLSEDEAKAFTRASSAFLYREWTVSIGAARQGGAAAPLSDAEFALLASTQATPKAPATRTSSRQSTRSRSTRKKKKKRRKSSR